MRQGIRTLKFLVIILFGPILFVPGIPTGQAQALTNEFNFQKLAVHTFPATPQTTFQNTTIGSWQVVSAIGSPSGAANLDNFVAYSFAAYSTGFSSGAVVSLAFLDSAAFILDGNVICGGSATVHQVATMVVDQLDGNLYMHGSFGADSWTPGPCGFISMTPAVLGPPITITLTGKAK